MKTPYKTGVGHSESTTLKENLQLYTHLPGTKKGFISKHFQSIEKRIAEATERNKKEITISAEINEIQIN